MPVVYEGTLVPIEGRILIVASRFNQLVVNQLVNGAMEALTRHGISEANVDIIRVPGAFEVPQAAQKALKTGRFVGLIALGAVIRGDTDHYDHIAHSATQGLNRIALDLGYPVAHGVLTCNTTEQALDRSGLKAGNKGYDAALALLEMVNLFTRIGG
ncbi:MAG: 6,7-dimethyl-8-ribityllumazine synthase [Gemmataceae bacterium]|nr:MAG: 6,7-dimethyl-8-ribityllumazine synthase [Planctomycetota bacterium]